MSLGAELRKLRRKTAKGSDGWLMEDEPLVRCRSCRISWMRSDEVLSVHPCGCVYCNDCLIDLLVKTRRDDSVPCGSCGVNITGHDRGCRRREERRQSDHDVASSTSPAFKPWPVRVVSGSKPCIPARTLRKRRQAEPAVTAIESDGDSVDDTAHDTKSDDDYVDDAKSDDDYVDIHYSETSSDKSSPEVPVPIDPDEVKVDKFEDGDTRNKQKRKLSPKTSTRKASLLKRIRLENHSAVTKGDKKAETERSPSASPRRGRKKRVDQPSGTGDKETELTPSAPPRRRGHIKLTDLFDEKFKKLCAFRDANGHCNVPSRDYAQLYKWVRYLQWGRVPVTEEQRQQLDAIEFPWWRPDLDPEAERQPIVDGNNDDSTSQQGGEGSTRKYVHKRTKQYLRCQAKLEKLLVFHESNGHCLVPGGKPGDEPLARWVRDLRRGRVQVAEKQRRQLDDIQFPWLVDPDACTVPVIAPGEHRNKMKSFDERMDELVSFKEKFGHCSVPHRYLDNRSLGEWVKNVRGGCNKISREQRSRLNKMGFNWETKWTMMNRQWNDSLDKLRRYKESHGDCNVPFEWDQDPKLAEWVKTQRRNMKTGKIKEDRKKLLDELGFDWKRGSNSAADGATVSKARD